MITADEKTNRYGSHYTYYRCTKKKKNIICNQRHINLKDLEPQILDYLSKVYVSEQLLDLAIEYLKEEEKEDSEKYLSVRQSVEKTLSNCHRKIDNLNQMRLNDLINDNEYLQEKKKLLHEKIKLEGSLSNRNANGNARKAIELTKKALIFANQGKDRFQNGSLGDKRSMLQGIQEIGSNFFLRDRKLIIEAEKPLLTLEEGLKAVNGGVKSLEPLKCGSGEPKNGLSSSQILCWHAVIEDVRTFFRKEVSTPQNI